MSTSKKTVAAKSCGDDKMEPSCIDLYVFAGQSNVLGWGVGPLEMQRVLSAHRRLAGGAL